jgi:para-nitrobenzyl esterase
VTGQLTIGGQSAAGGSVSPAHLPAKRGTVPAGVIDSGIFTQLYPGGRGPGRIMKFTVAQAAGVKVFEFLGSRPCGGPALPAEFIRDKDQEFRGFWGRVMAGSSEWQG